MGERKIRRFETNLAVLPMMCEYCSSWSSAERYGFQDQDEGDETAEKQVRRKTTGSRRCLRANKDVLAKTPSCKDFTLHPVFWCQRNSQVYDAIVCIARQKKKFENCPGCRQGAMLWRYFTAFTFQENKGGETNEERD